MILAKKEILACLEDGSIEIEPFCSEQLRSNSYDVRLGNWFYQVRLVEGERVYFGPRWYDEGKLVPLPFGVGLLGMTVEQIRTKGDLVVQLRAKSTTGREFWTVCQDAGLGDIGYSNHWTAEFSSHLLGTTYLVVGQRFGQVVFHATTEADEVYDGQYATTRWPECMVPAKYRDFVRPWGEE